MRFDSTYGIHIRGNDEDVGDTSVALTIGFEIYDQRE